MLVIGKIRYVKKNFDAWAYNLYWPQCANELVHYNTLQLTAEDIKFAYNAWCLLRLAMFFGLGYPKVLSNLAHTVPSMSISQRGNNIFHKHIYVNTSLNAQACKIALAPCSPRAVALQEFDWQEVISTMQLHKLEGSQSSTHFTNVELIVGMENGMSNELMEQCDHHIYIPQYGSIGSLSMLSALAIATHHASCTIYDHSNKHKMLEQQQEKREQHQWECQEKHNEQSNEKTTKQICEERVVVRGHMPESNTSQLSVTEQKLMPHEASLLHLSNKQIMEILEERRRSYPLQLSVIMYNEFGDRNIGAVMRNANAYNCEWMLILGRRRFNRRGALGTNHLLNVHLLEDTTENQCYVEDILLKDYELWLVYQYYPYLKIEWEHDKTNNYKEETQREKISDSSQCDSIPHIKKEETYISSSDARLIRWGSAIHSETETHPFYLQYPKLQSHHNTVYLNDSKQIAAAVREVYTSHKRGIALMFAEEGSTFNPFLANITSKVVYILHPRYMSLCVQRGLNAALSSSIVLERLRTAIDGLDAADTM